MAVENLISFEPVRLPIDGHHCNQRGRNRSGQLSRPKPAFSGEAIVSYVSQITRQRRGRGAHYPVHLQETVIYGAVSAGRRPP